MTISEIKNTMETMLPENWEYCHDTYAEKAIDEELDINGMINDGFTVSEIAQEIIDNAIRMENNAFEWATDHIWDADGVNATDGEVYVDDEFYTHGHMQELVNTIRDAFEDEKAERAMYWDSFKW